MLTELQYSKLLPHKAVITFVAEGGGGHNFPQQIWDLRHELNINVDMTCNGCKVNYITDLFNLMKEYEDGSTKG